MARREVAHLVCPVDVQDWPVKAAHYSMMNVKGEPHTMAQFDPDAVIPRPDLLRKAADLLNQGKKTAILVGQGAPGAGAEVEKVADVLAAPVIKALLAKAIIPDDSPYTTGGLGLVGTAASEKAMEECDSLLVVGSNFPCVKFLPEPGQAKAVQIDGDAERIGARYPVDVGLRRDARSTLRALHLAQVLQMALHQAAEGPPGGFPEVRYPDVRLDGADAGARAHRGGPRRRGSVGGRCGLGAGHRSKETDLSGLRFAAVVATGRDREAPGEDNKKWPRRQAT
jgi:thiamine pyrophosphate-dependent acetolactate synthase large subunit-like protein